jgi:hypothetical protein
MLIQKQNENIFIILDVICLKFLDQIYSSIFLNCDIYVLFLSLPFIPKTR